MCYTSSTHLRIQWKRVTPSGEGEFEASEEEIDDSSAGTVAKVAGRVEKSLEGD